MSELRQVVLDTETTGLEVEQGHRVIEIGCIELRDRRLTGNNFHRYINPQRTVDEQAAAIHGLTDERLAQEPVFAALADDLWNYLQGAELIIHNAAFDIGFLEAEFARTGKDRKLATVCPVIDTVALARKLHPGQRVNLDALCRRYGIDNSKRDLHGALLDAELLAEVYLAMTGGQASLGLERARPILHATPAGGGCLAQPAVPLIVVRANAREIQIHRERLAAIAEAAGGSCLWRDDLPPP